MPTSNPFDILLMHDKWATGQILQACIPLSPEQFHRKFDMGPGSLHNTTLHMMSAMRLWTDVLYERPTRAMMDPVADAKTAEEQLKIWEQIADEFAGVARKFPLDGLVKREHGGKVYSFPRGGVITHVATHGMHHRAQCLNMLRHVGVSPLPRSSVVEWMRDVDFPQQL
jgi:uncharacterized damage-inducible protein DinB